MGSCETCCRIFEKIIFIVIGLLALSVTIYEIVVWLTILFSWQTDLQSPAKSSMVSIPFPRVTLCSRASVNASYRQLSQGLQRDLALSYALPSVSWELLSSANTTQTWSSGVLEKTIDDFEAYLASPQNSDGITALHAYLNLGYQCSSFVASCRVGNITFDCCDRSSLVPTYYGPCTTLDPYKFQLVPGYRGALTIKLYVDQGNFVKFSGQGKSHPGFWLFVDSEDYFLSDPILVNLGKETLIQMDHAHVSNMGEPYTGPMTCIRPPRGSFRLDPFTSEQNTNDNERKLWAYQQNRTEKVEACRRDCLYQAINTFCGCKPMPFEPEYFEAPAPWLASRRCLANDSQNCVEPLLSGQILPSSLAMSGSSSRRAGMFPSSQSSQQQMTTTPMAKSPNTTGNATTKKSVAKRQAHPAPTTTAKTTSTSTTTKLPNPATAKQTAQPQPTSRSPNLVVSTIPPTHPQRELTTVSASVNVASVNASALKDDPRTTTPESVKMKSKEQSQNGQQQPGVSGIDVISQCQQQCPSFCFDRKASVSFVQSVDLNQYLYREQNYILPQTALVRLYYGSANFNKQREFPKSFSLYAYLRELGLTVAIWAVIAAILIGQLCGTRSLISYCCEYFSGDRKHRIDPYPIANGGADMPHNYNESMGGEK